MAYLFINVNHDVGYESSESIPISLGYVLANLKALGRKGLILDDLRDRPLSLKALEKWIAKINPDVIGFTAYQSTMNRIRYLSRYIKSRHRRIRIVLGGPQIIAMPSSALEELEDIDVLIHGEGELVMADLAAAIESGASSLESVGGISFRNNGAIVETGPGADPPDDLDVYPSPYLSRALNLTGKTTAILLSSRGCSHVCKFCITPKICKSKVRYHSIERVIEEMKMLAGAGIERFWFADPSFTEDRERTELLLEEKIKHNIQTPFWLQSRADQVDQALLLKLKKAGADTIAFGLESGSPAVLDATNKGIVLEQLSENVSAAQALGMESELFSIFGLPGETVDNARETLEFVKSLGIPIQSNSGSQQMQLYFGAIYERNPKAFGIKPLETYRPKYMSVGDNYETAAMSAKQIAKVRSFWALANQQMEQDVYYKQRTFEVIDFLITNRDDLLDEPAYYAYGALTAGVIEEFDLLIEFISGYAKIFDTQEAAEELIGSLSLFVETDEPAGPMDRVIFDSRSWIGEVPFTGISGKYWDVLLGRGLLLPEFEQGFMGVRTGDEAQFGFTFPDNYGQEELRGKTVDVKAKIHKVFKSPNIKSLDDVKKLKRNSYPFKDLDLLREQNEILYYLALRDTPPRELLRTPSHFLMLAHRFAKLGKKNEIAELASLLKGKPTALNALADTLVGSGKHSWALDYYESLSKTLPSAALKLVRCLLRMDKAGLAMSMTESMPQGNDLEFQETLLECLKAAKPNSQRIPSLEHHVLDLKITAALGREAVSKTVSSTGPIVHGDFDKRG